MQKLIPYCLAGALAVGAFATTGCVATVRGGAHVSTPAPELVYVQPGVWVVADYDEPVFYHGDSYWLYRNGLWYRSSVHYGGWTRVYTTPVSVRRIHRPRTYVRYRARAGVRTRRGPPPRRASPAVRDHRRAAPPPRRASPAVRDHRRAAPPARRNDRVRSQPQPKRSSPVIQRDHRKEKAAPPPKREPRVKTRDHRKDD